eukprot:767439-Hanusia_phi.AAC.2
MPSFDDGGREQWEAEEGAEEGAEKEKWRVEADSDLMQWEGKDAEDKNLFPRLRRIKHALQTAMIESSSWETHEELMGVRFPGQAKLKDGLDLEEVETLKSMLEVMKELEKLYRLSVRTNARRSKICASLDECRSECIHGVREFKSTVRDMVHKHDKWYTTWKACTELVTQAERGEVQQQMRAEEACPSGRGRSQSLISNVTGTSACSHPVSMSRDTSNWLQR